MPIELRYQCYIHACSKNYLGNIFQLFFLSFFRFFCVKRPDGVLGHPYGDPECSDGISGVWTIQLFRPDAHSSFLDDCVFTTSTWHYVRTSLKFRPDGEPCRVKSHSPRAAAHVLVSFCVFLLSCAFFSYFLCIVLTCSCRLCILFPPQVCINTLLLFFF